MNDACVKFFAHSRAPLTKTNILDLLDASDRTSLEQVVQALNRGRGVVVLTLDVTFRLRNRQSKPARDRWHSSRRRGPVTEAGFLSFTIPRRSNGKKRARCPGGCVAPGST